MKLEYRSMKIILIDSEESYCINLANRNISVFKTFWLPLFYPPERNTKEREINADLFFKIKKMISFYQILPKDKKKKRKKAWERILTLIP